MNSSLRSKLFLITYGTILAFIVGLIIFNNTILRSYYSYRKNNQLVNTFEAYRNIDIESSDYEEQMRIVESTENVSIQVIYEPQAFDLEKSFDDLLVEPSFYERLYGSPYTMNRQAIIQLIYDYHHQNETILDHTVQLDD